jgi:hypothetical protein
MAKKQEDQPQGDFPSAISNPARRALLGAGYTSVEQLAGVSERELLALHGMGPKAMGILKSTLAEKGLAFGPDSKAQVTKP